MKVRLKASEKFVADWYEENKDNFDTNLFCLISNPCDRTEELDEWLITENNPITILVNMNQFGYEIEKVKEKFYYVELPRVTFYNNRPQWLCYDKTYFISSNNSELFKNIFTEKEIKDNVPWAWQFAKEII